MLGESKSIALERAGSQQSIWVSPCWHEAHCVKTCKKYQWSATIEVTSEVAFFAVYWLLLR